MFKKKHFSFDSFSKSKNSATTVRRILAKVRARNAPFETLALELFELDEPLPLSDAAKIQELLARDEVVLRDAVGTLVRARREQQRCDDFGPLAEFERELYRGAWVSAMLLIHSSAEVHRAIANSRQCLDLLLNRAVALHAADSSAELDDDVVLALAARVLLVALHVNFASVLAAVAEWRGDATDCGERQVEGRAWVRELVKRGMHSHYAPILLSSVLSERRPRISAAVARRVQLPHERFSAAHKRGVEILALASVHDVLADEFCDASGFLKLACSSQDGAMRSTNEEDLVSQLRIPQSAVLQRCSSSRRSFSNVPDTVELSGWEAHCDADGNASTDPRVMVYRGERDAPRKPPLYRMTSPSEFLMRAVLRAANCAKAMQGVAERAMLAERRAAVAASAAAFESGVTNMQPAEYNALLSSLDVVTNPAPFVRVLNEAYDLIESPLPGASNGDASVNGDSGVESFLSKSLQRSVISANGFESDGEEAQDVVYQLRQQIFAAAMDMCAGVIDLVELALRGDGGGDAFFAQRVSESWDAAGSLQDALIALVPRMCRVISSSEGYVRRSRANRLGLVRFVVARVLLALMRVAGERLARKLAEASAASDVLELALLSKTSSLLACNLSRTVAMCIMSGTGGSTETSREVLKLSWLCDARLLERLSAVFGDSDSSRLSLQHSPFMPLVRFLFNHIVAIEPFCSADGVYTFGARFGAIMQSVDEALKNVPPESYFNVGLSALDAPLGVSATSTSASLPISAMRSPLPSASELSGMHVAPNIVEDGGDALYFQMMLRMLRLSQSDSSGSSTSSSSSGGGGGSGSGGGGGNSAMSIGFGGGGGGGGNSSSSSSGGAGGFSGSPSNQLKLFEFVGSIAKKRAKEKQQRTPSAAKTAVSSFIPRTASF